MISMSEGVIAREDLPPLTAWQAFSFDPPSMHPLPVKVPTADEIDAMHRQARDEGYRDGLAQGAAEIERFKSLNQHLATAATALEGEIAAAILTLSLGLAKQILREAIAVRPELVLTVVREALGTLVSNLKDNVLLLHPTDVDLVRRHLGDDLTRTAVRLVADEQIEAGGCRLEAANGSVDATLAERWKQALALLGRQDGWLA